MQCKDEDEEEDEEDEEDDDCAAEWIYLQYSSTATSTDSVHSEGFFIDQLWGIVDLIASRAMMICGTRNQLGGRSGWGGVRSR